MLGVLASFIDMEYLGKKCSVINVKRQSTMFSFYLGIFCLCSARYNYKVLIMNRIIS